MPAATISQRRENFERLHGSLSPHCAPDETRTRVAQGAAVQMPLSHATSFGNLQPILSNGALMSQVQSGRPPGNAESILETADDVFLYAAAFSYPDTDCGFLFVSSLEVGHEGDGVATPFDSGALATMEFVKPSPPYTEGVTFVRDHELPVSDYRNILSTIISEYSRSLEHYLDRPEDFSCFSCGTSRAHPYGLSGGDRRAATFELRIPQRVPLQPPHLRAVFVREGFETAELSTLFASGVTIERYAANDDDSFFHAMRASCISFILEHSIS